MDHIGREQKLTIGGRDYIISRLERRHWAEFMEFCKKVLPDPVETLLKDLERFPVDIQHKLAAEAFNQKTRHKSLFSPEVVEVFGSVEGMSHILYIALRQHHPDITEDQAFELFFEFVAEHGQAELEAKLNKAAGILPSQDGPPEQKKTGEPPTGGK